MQGSTHLKKWTIRQRILISFGLIVTLMAVMAIIAYTRLSAIEEDTRTVKTDSLPGLYTAAGIRFAWDESYVLAQRLVFIDADPASLKRDETRIAETQQALDQFAQGYQKTLFIDREQVRFNNFKAVQDQYEQGLKAVLEQVTTSKAAAVSAFNTRLAPSWEIGAGLISGIVDQEKNAAGDDTASILNSVREAEIALFAAVLVVLAVAVITGYFLLRAITVPMSRVVDTLDVMRAGDLTQRLDIRRTDEFGTLAVGFNRMTDELTALVGQAQQSSLQVTTSVTEIAATSKEQQATASETAATTTEIGATSREIFATSRDLVRTMNEVSAVSDHAALLAGTGREGLTRMEETMHHVMDAAGSVNAKLAILNEKAGDINQVVATIAKVADQTNLLSLNAAIEAEKAGEYGRGFAVVATEIRRLADQTAVATFDIEQTVKEIQSAVSAGVMGMDKFTEEVRRGMLDVQQVGGQLSQIIGQVQTLAPRFQMVNEGMQTQATGAEQINQALTQLSEAAQQTVESLRQSSQAIDDLTLVASGLRTGVSRFKVAA
jgi:methyl-accepting chemotaxis protein WspA